MSIEHLNKQQRPYDGENQSLEGRQRQDHARGREFARDIRKVATMPVMVTDGIRRRQVAEQVIQSGVDMVGIATVLAIDPYLPVDWRMGIDNAPELCP